MPDAALLAAAAAPRAAPFALVGRHLPVLDGIRGLAILAVMAHHFAGQFHSAVSSAAEVNFLCVLQAGWIGVDLFFVLSGFLITGILLDTRAAHNYFTAFYGRRVLRIFPAYYATLFGLLVVLPLLSARLPDSFREALRTMADHQAWFWAYAVNWLLVWDAQNADSIPGQYFWSLAIEEQFYIVWPFIVYWLDRDGLRKLILVLVPAGLLARLCVIMSGDYAQSLYFATFTHLDGLLAGALLAILMRSPAPPLRPGNRFNVCAAAAALTLVAIGLSQGHFYFWDDAVAGVGQFLLAVCFAWLLLATVTAEKNSVLVRFFSHPVLRSFGKFSYAIYLFHIPIGLALHKVFTPQQYRLADSLIPVIVVTILGGTAVSWCAGYLSWHLFEKQFLKWKSLFDYDAVPLSAPSPSL